MPGKGLGYEVYPRVYGGTTRGLTRGFTHRGLSPRVRGNRRAHESARRRTRSIPACTGEPHERRNWCGCGGVYPRVYGGTFAGVTRRLREEGLSPRVRGNHSRAKSGTRKQVGLSPRVRGNPPLTMRQIGNAGSIPACTGEPPDTLQEEFWGKVYPRVYGGTSAQGRQNRDPDGSIPACTGEPGQRGCSGQRCQVYPRVYGGTGVYREPEVIEMGLSPRVRGNPGLSAGGRPGGRSIPACTGEPEARLISEWTGRVYPRVYGGTFSAARGLRPRKGLSPRVRGNRVAPRRDRPDRGSYPRVYGGTKRFCSTKCRVYGLSPRVRGNRSRGYRANNA